MNPKQRFGGNDHDRQNNYTSEDAEKSKAVAGLSYFLFFLPLISCPESGYAKFHANQTLILRIASIAGCVILSIIFVIGWILLPIYAVGASILGIMGLVNGFGRRAMRLLLIGKFDIIK